MIIHVNPNQNVFNLQGLFPAWAPFWLARRNSLKNSWNKSGDTPKTSEHGQPPLRIRQPWAETSQITPLVESLASLTIVMTNPPRYHPAMSPPEQKGRAFSNLWQECEVAHAQTTVHLSLAGWNSNKFRTIILDCSCWLAIASPSCHGLWFSISFCQKYWPSSTITITLATIQMGINFWNEETSRFAYMLTVAVKSQAVFWNKTISLEKTVHDTNIQHNIWLEPSW